MVAQSLGMAKRKNPRLSRGHIPPTRETLPVQKESPSRRGRRTVATLDPSDTYAPPHNQDRGLTQQQVEDTMDDVDRDAGVGGGGRAGTVGGGGFGTGGFGRGGFGGGGLNSAPLNTQGLNDTSAPRRDALGTEAFGLVRPSNPPPGAATRIITGEDPDVVLGGTEPTPEPVRETPPPGATSPVSARTQPPQPDSSAVNQPAIVNSPLVIREGESLTVAEREPRRLRANAYERVGSPPHKEIALIQLRGLIEACDEAVKFDRARNVRPPYLWLDDKQYLAELRDILIELRRLNTFLEASSSTEPAVLKSVDKSASRIGKFFDAYASEMGKGAAQLTKGAIILGLVWAGVGDAALAKLMGR